MEKIIMTDFNLLAVDCPDGKIEVLLENHAILTLTPVQALSLAADLKNAVNNHTIELLRLIKES